MAHELVQDTSAEITDVLHIAMIQFDKSGKPLSMNRVCLDLLESLRIVPDALAEALPSQSRSLIRRSLRDRQAHEMNWLQNGRSLHLIFKSSQRDASVYLFIIDLTAQNEAKAQLIQSEKMASLGLLVAGLAHEINTPLGAIHSNNDTVSRLLSRLRDLLDKKDDLSETDRERAIERLTGIMQEVSETTSLATDRLIDIVGSLKNFARLDETDFKKADIHQGMDSTLTIVEHRFRNRIRVDKEYLSGPLMVECHPNRLNQVFMNLLINAAQAIPDRGTITIRTSRKSDVVRIAISDTGVGIPKENISRIFDPGFTTKGVGVGTGLGLSICYKIIQEHHGKIEVESNPGGTTFTITLPISHTRKVKRG